MTFLLSCNALSQIAFAKQSDNYSLVYHVSRLKRRLFSIGFRDGSVVLSITNNLTLDNFLQKCCGGSVLSAESFNFFRFRRRRDLRFKPLLVPSTQFNCIEITDHKYLFPLSPLT